MLAITDTDPPTSAQKARTVDPTAAHTAPFYVIGVRRDGTVAGPFAAPDREAAMVRRRSILGQCARVDVITCDGRTVPVWGAR